MMLGAAGCATGPTVTVSQPLAESADAPYRNVLVVCLFSSFDARRYLEDEIVKRLEGLGISAVASTSMMDSRTPVVPKTFIDMVDEVGAEDMRRLERFLLLDAIDTFLERNESGFGADGHGHGTG